MISRSEKFCIKNDIEELKNKIEKINEAIRDDLDKYRHDLVVEKFKELIDKFLNSEKHYNTLRWCETSKNFEYRSSACLIHEYKKHNFSKKEILLFLKLLFNDNDNYINEPHNEVINEIMKDYVNILENENVKAS